MGHLSKSFMLWLSVLIVPSMMAQTKESMLIGPGDLLHVQVFDTPELEQHARVTDAGELPLLLGGSVRVAALTPGEAGLAIQDALIRGHFLLNPRVLVTFDANVTQMVSVLGEVHAPGAYAIQTPRSILEVLALAGGLSDLADRRVLIERHGTSQKVPYFVSNSPDAAIDGAVNVNPGDTIIVPKAALVYVLGDVKNPGGYTMTNNDAQLTVLELIARAGGTNHTAIASHAKLIRTSGGAYVVTPLHLSDMQKGKLADFPLNAEDIVYVPFSYLRNFAVQGSGIAASAASAAVYRF